MPKDPIIHKDILGNEIKLGDAVVSPNGRDLSIGTVIKIHKVMIDVTRIGSRLTERRYPANILVVDDPKITLYILQNAKS